MLVPVRLGGSGILLYVTWGFVIGAVPIVLWSPPRWRKKERSQSCVRTKGRAP